MAPTAHPLPGTMPVLGNASRRSRRPLIIVRLAEETPKLRLSRQDAVRRSEYYIAHELTFPTLVDLECDDSLFAKIMAYHAMMESGALFVPEWFELTEMAKARIEVAARDLGVQNVSSGVTEPVRQPLRLIAKDGAGRFIDPDVTKIASSRSSAAVWLREVWESQKQAVADTVYAGYSSPVRDFAAARCAATELAANGATQPEIKGYLTVFGYENPKSTLGRWTRHVDVLRAPGSTDAVGKGNLR